MENLENKSLAELRILYPTLKAASKAVMLEKIQALNEIEIVAEQLSISTDEVSAVIDELSEVNKSTYDKDSNILTWYNIEEFIFEECRSSKKFLIETPTAIEADLMWARLNEEVFPKLNEENVNVMASSSRRDMHLNGTCYIRLVCHTNFNHIKGLLPYTDFKVLT